MKRVLYIALGLLFAWVLVDHERTGLADAPATVPGEIGESSSIARAFSERVSGIQLSGRGTVVRVLADDNDGSRHQRFILEITDGQTLLIAHNIDVAPRIPGIEAGDTVSFYGEYEWNPQGGVIHWTHHDPRGQHPGGWLDHEGRRYE